MSLKGKSLNVALSLLIVLSAITIQCTEDKSISEEETKNDIKTELPINEALEAATRWKDAVMNRDIDVLLEYALPEYKDPVRKQLKDKNSLLYQYILRDEKHLGKSYYEFFKSVDNINIRAVHYTLLGFTVFYYDVKFTQEVNAAIDESRYGPRIGELMKRGVLINHYFYKSSGSWYANYEFGGS